MTKEIEIPEGYEARIEGNKVVLEPKESEEDELMLKRCIADLGYLTEYEPQYKERYDAQIAWLKSLSERFNLQPKNEWGEEDEEMLEDIKFNFVYNKEKMTDALIAQYNRFFDKIKSLKPQPRQEWSDEDEKMLRTIISDGSRGVELDSKQISWLKSLRPQPHWKPSEEQLGTLLEAKGVLSESSHFVLSDKVFGIFKELKKLI